MSKNCHINNIEFIKKQNQESNTSGNQPQSEQNQRPPQNIQSSDQNNFSADSKAGFDSVVSMILELKFLFHQSIEMFLLNAIFYNAVSMNTISINNRNPSRRC